LPTLAATLAAVRATGAAAHAARPKAGAAHAARPAGAFLHPLDLLVGLLLRQLAVRDSLLNLSDALGLHILARLLQRRLQHVGGDAEVLGQ